MYLFKNAFRNITRSKGRNILIGVIITVITLCTCIGLAIHKAGTNLVNSYVKNNPLEVSFQLDMDKLRNASDDVKNSFTSLTVDEVKKYGESDLVKDYYYTLEANMDSSSLTAVEDNSRPDSQNSNSSSNNNDKNAPSDMKASMGDFRLTAYSNFAYLDDFTDGTKKITSGKMVTGSSEADEVVISKSLADANNLSVGSTITLCLPSDTSTTFTFTVIGIYKDTSDSSSNSFISVNALNSSNQIYANLSSLTKILAKTSTDNTKMVANNGLSAKYYLKDNNDLAAFKKEVQKKGLSTYYTVNTNKEEVLSTLKPIQNISTFSLNFLIVILVIGAVVLAVINFLNIRDRKYEVGVLRAIGMSKFKVTTQFILEMFIVAMASLIIGTVGGLLISQPVTNKMLKSEISSYEKSQTQTQKNFGGPGFNKPSQNSNSSNNNYVNSLKVKIDAITILELFGITLLLTITSGGVASAFVNKYNPNRILQDRS